MQVNRTAPAFARAAFHWKSGAAIESLLTDVAPRATIAWTGKTFGIRAIHAWRFSPQDGDTHVETEESFDGWLARLLPGVMRKMLQSALNHGLRALKIECERRARL